MVGFRVACVLIGLLSFPAAGTAGPIAFGVGGRIDVEPGHPALAAGLSFTDAPGGYAFDPMLHMSTVVPLVAIAPPVLPSDPANAPNQGGGTYYDAAYVTMTVSVTDFASARTGTLTIGGRVHMEWSYAGDNRWVGGGYLWTDGQPRTLDLGGNEYTVWLPQWYASPNPQLSVWVGPDAPITASPEPGTLALAGLGIAVAGFARGRRWKIAGVGG